MTNSDLVGETGCRKQHTLSGNHDEDYFLTAEDMSKSHWLLLMGCYHQGQCYQDVEEAAKYFQFPSDAALVSACEYLLSAGIDPDMFLYDGVEEVKSVEDIEDEDAVMRYYLWVLSGDIQEKE